MPSKSWKRGFHPRIALIFLASSSSDAYPLSRPAKRPTLTSISQRRTLASMVSLSLNSPQLLRATRAYKPLVHFGAVLRDRSSTRVGFGRTSMPKEGPTREDSFDAGSSEASK